jgi:hypothetical protein
MGDVAALTSGRESQRPECGNHRGDRHPIPRAQRNAEDEQAEDRGDDEVGADDGLRQEQWNQSGSDDATHEADDVEDDADDE